MQRRINILQEGIVIRHRQFRKCACYDSFKTRWYWGPERLSEVFHSIEAAVKLKEFFPEGEPVSYGVLGWFYDRPSRVLWRQGVIDVNGVWYPKEEF